MIRVDTSKTVADSPIEVTKDMLKELEQCLDAKAEQHTGPDDDELSIAGKDCVRVSRIAQHCAGGRANEGDMPVETPNVLAELDDVSSNADSGRPDLNPGKSIYPYHLPGLCSPQYTCFVPERSSTERQMALTRKEKLIPIQRMRYLYVNLRTQDLKNLCRTR